MADHNDSRGTAVESDILVPPKLHTSLQDLLHPSVYPSVYDCSGVFGNEVVGVNNAIENFVGKEGFKQGDSGGRCPRGKRTTRFF